LQIKIRCFKFLSDISVKIYEFFKNNRGFYAITKGVGPRSAPPVAGLVRQGKINLYESIVWTVSSNAGTSKRTYNFFNMELGNLKYANFRNLQPVMRSNPESMAHLYKFRNAGIAASTLQIGGFLTTLAGFGVFMARGFDSFENDTELKFGLPITLGLSGITMGACGYLFGLSKPKHLRMAVSTFNE